MIGPQIALRLLTGQAEEMGQLQRVLESAPRYTHLVTGALAGPADAQSAYTALPEGKGYEDKFVFGIFLEEQMVGCADLIRGYPDSHTAHLGLLLIAEDHQGRGCGTAAYQEIENTVRAWGTCWRMRLGVIRTNSPALAFWRHRGFVETGEFKPYRYGNVVSETIVLHKPLTAQ